MIEASGLFARCAAKIAAIAAAIGFTLTSMQTINAEEALKPVGSAGDHGDLAAAFFSFLNSRSVQYRIDRSIEALGATILDHLQYAGGGGLLLVAEVGSLENDAGKLFSTSTDHVYIVGIGQTPELAYLASLESAKVMPGFADGFKKDLGASTAYWFQKDGKQGITRSSQPVETVLRKVFGLYGDEAQKLALLKAQRSTEISRLVDGLARRVTDGKLRSRLLSLDENRKSALARLKSIEQELDRQLALAAASRKNAAFLDAMSTILSFAQLSYEAGQGMPAEVKEELAKQNSVDGLRSVLDRAEWDAMEKAETTDVLRPGLYQEIEKTEQDELQILRENGAPVYNVPRY